MLRAPTYERPSSKDYVTSAMSRVATSSSNTEMPRGSPRGSLLSRPGRFADGLALLEKAHSSALQKHALYFVPHRARQLSTVYRLSGRVPEAWPVARQALDHARRQKMRGREVPALIELGALHAEANPPDVRQSEAHYREALTLAAELGMRPLVAHCHHGLGKLYCRTGKADQAREHLTTATTMYRDMDMRFWLEQAEAELKELT